MKVGGKTCLDLGASDAPLAYVPSKNTIVLTMKANMGTVVAVTEPKGPLLERLKKADADNDIIIALEPEAFPNLDKILDMAKRRPAPGGELPGRRQDGCRAEPRPSA